MGTSIAELLGMQLPDEPVAEDNSNSEGDAKNPTGDKVWETVVSAMLEVSDLPAEHYQPQLSLKTDFDLHPIALFAVVSHIEEDLGIKLADQQILECQTLADLVALAKA